VLIVVQNLPVPFDRRVWLEATTLARAGYQVSVICPKAKGFTASFEVLEDVHIYRYRLPVDAKGAVVKSQEMAVDGPRFRAVAPQDAQNLASVRIYAWDAASRMDGLGKVSLEGAPPSGQGGSTP